MGRALHQSYAWSQGFAHLSQFAPPPSAGRLHDEAPPCFKSARRRGINRRNDSDSWVNPTLNYRVTTFYLAISPVTARNTGAILVWKLSITIFSTGSDPINCRLK